MVVPITEEPAYPPTPELTTGRTTGTPVTHYGDTIMTDTTQTRSDTAKAGSPFTTPQGLFTVIPPTEQPEVTGTLFTTTQELFTVISPTGQRQVTGKSGRQPPAPTALPSKVTSSNKIISGSGGLVMSNVVYLSLSHRFKIAKLSLGFKD